MSLDALAEHKVTPNSGDHPATHSTLDQSYLEDHDVITYFLGECALCLDEQRIVRQFLEALMFERSLLFTAVARSELTIDDHSISQAYSDILVFQIGALRCLCIGARKAFSRIRIADGSIKFLQQGKYVDLSLNTMLECLPTDSSSRQRLQQELGQTLELCRWNRNHLKAPFSSRRQSNFNELEARIHEGHLYHPCFKVRTGFTLKDHILYGPEAENTFQLVWLAIKKPLLHTNLGLEESAFWCRELGAQTFQTLSERLIENAANWDTYSLTPIHPWQLKSLYDAGLIQEIAKANIINLGTAGDKYQAGQSLRTLMNVSHPDKANVKLPLNIISTSSHRNLQEHFVCSAPVMSGWLDNIVQNDPFLEKINRVVILQEYAGVLYEQNKQLIEKNGTTQAPSLNPDLSAKIGAIFRQSVQSKLHSGEAAVPFSALMLMESDGRPFIADWIERYGLESWLDQLIDVVVIPIWHLLVHQGVAFESHGQNLILIHRNGLPCKIAMRDFHEETEYTRTFLPESGCEPPLQELDAFFTTIPDDDGHHVSTVESLRDMFTDTICVFNLTELSFLLEREYDYKESVFWQTVSRKIQQYNQSRVTSMDRIQKVQANSRTLQVESLLTKKIRNGGTLDFFFHSVSNELKYV